jgi:ATP-dependent RNA/DNA helicase IGHMBP2
MPKKDECFKCHKKITSVTSVKCRFCEISFCRNHVLAEEHGCDDAAKREERGNNREIDRLCELGADKIKQKIKEQEEARKKKGKEEKNKKK